MKHFRPDYNQRIQDSANIIPSDEPVFLMRAQDMHMPAMLLEYRDRLKMEGASLRDLKQIDEIYTATIVWQREHGHKTPDAPVHHE